MQTALDAGWNALHSSESELASDDRREATRLLLATRIVDLARAGETKYGQLLMGALDGLIDPVTRAGLPLSNGSLTDRSARG